MKLRGRIPTVALLIIGAALSGPEGAWAQPATGPANSFKDCADCPALVTIPPGEFVMGSPDDERGRNVAEGPQRRVTIARPPALGVTTITRDHYAAFAAATKRPDPDHCFSQDAEEQWTDVPGRSWRNPGFAQTGSDPAVCVSWEDAMDYAAWLSEKTGKNYRLPSEAEWEFAARAGKTGPRIWDGAPDAQCAYANGADLTAKAHFTHLNTPACSDGHTTTAPVASFRPNGFGLHDMAGNVWQWTGDCWNDTYKDARSDGGAMETGVCRLRAYRGGSWWSNPASLRPANRSWGTKGTRLSYLGFRIAREAEERP